MPSQKKKLKPEPKQQPPAAAAAAAAPVQIKAEPLDIKPLSAFVDDRVELIRQAFMSLKPKEIKTLAPDFMDGKSIEFIQEQCLDEVLGISTKRLLAIINSTRCPTDTESSSSDEDGPKITEHISLDEISSDSEVEVKPVIKPTKSRDKKLTKKAKPGAEQQPKKSNQSEGAAASKNGGKKSEKEMTVLELLELQARARAIRSQLALEPVTKIELDSDQEGEPAGESSEKAANKTSNDNATVAAPKAATPSEDQQSGKRIRLKRNFRIRQVGDEDIPDEVSQEETPIPKEPTPTRKSRSPSKEKDKPEEVQQVEAPEKEVADDSVTKSRESSPEVIPVIASPETLCISSDSEDEKERKRKASIFVDNIEELDRKAKEKEAEKEPPKPVENEEPEEGELSEEEKSPRKEPDGDGKQDKEEPTEDNLEAEVLELDCEVREISDSEPETSVTQDKELSQTDTAEPQPTKNDEDRPSTVNENSNDESEPESVASKSDHEQEEAAPTKQKEPSSSEDEEDVDDDVVEIHDSSDETLLDQKLAEEESEKSSWNTRWLRSNRVAKVMAASRLGNKVRDKMKKQKKKKQQEEAEQEAAKQQLAEDEASKQQAEEEAPPVSSAEVGSVEHYRELLAKSVDAAKDKEVGEDTS